MSVTERRNYDASDDRGAWDFGGGSVVLITLGVMGLTIAERDFSSGPQVEPPAIEPTTTDSTTTDSTTTDSTTTDSTTTTTEVRDYPLFVNAQFVSPAVPGATIRFRFACSRPLVEGDRAMVSVSHVNGTGGGHDALSGDVVFDGSAFYSDWVIPANQELGEYEVRAWCHGPSDTLETDYVDASRGPILPFWLVASLTVPETE